MGRGYDGVRTRIYAERTALLLPAGHTELLEPPGIPSKETGGEGLWGTQCREKLMKHRHDLGSWSLKGLSKGWRGGDGQGPTRAWLRVPRGAVSRCLDWTPSLRLWPWSLSPEWGPREQPGMGHGEFPQHPASCPGLSGWRSILNLNLPYYQFLAIPFYAH